VAKRKRSYKEQQEFAGIEAAIEKTEARKVELTDALASGELFKSDPAKARAFSEELASIDGQIEKLYARWQELSELLPM
jgi:hypothetical protein